MTLRPSMLLKLATYSAERLYNAPRKGGAPSSSATEKYVDELWQHHNLFDTSGTTGTENAGSMPSAPASGESR